LRFASSPAAQLARVCAWVGRGPFVDGRERENRLAFVQRLVGQAHLDADLAHDGVLRHAAGGLARVGRAGEVLGGEDRRHARHGQRLSRVDPPHARVRHRAEQQLAEQHAVGTKIFRVLGAPGDLRDEVGRLIVLADQREGRHLAPFRCQLSVFSYQFSGAPCASYA